MVIAKRKLNRCIKAKNRGRAICCADGILFSESARNSECKKGRFAAEIGAPALTDNSAVRGARADF
jgi:hypothetical protein